MIQKEEIDEKSHELGVNTSDIQRDYVFGWLLSGLANNTDTLKDKLILKGGNCFRKAYFENARYSNDLDFSTQMHITAEEIERELEKVCSYIGDFTGIKFAVEDNKVSLKKNADEDNKIYEAKVYFKGFYGEEKYNLKVKMDVKEFDKIFLPIQTRNIIHSYSDFENCKGEIKCWKLEELLASKLKALLQRRHSPDLYDFVYSILFPQDLELNRSEIVRTFLKKTIYDRRPVNAKSLLLELPFQTIKALWNQYLVCPKNYIIDFQQAENKFKDTVIELFSILQPNYASASGGGNEIEYTRNYFPAKYRNVIMDAGHGQKLVKMVYDGLERLIEPYALTYKITKEGVGKEYLFAWDRLGGRSGVQSIKTYTQDKISEMELLEESFTPRYPIELTKAGEYTRDKYFSRPKSDDTSDVYMRLYRPSRPKKPRKSRTSFSNPYSLNLTLQCPYCNKTFKRSSYSDAKLNKHKDKYGNKCYGTTGYFI